MQDEIEQLRTDLAALRTELEKLREELADLRRYIGEVPTMECGITSFEDWKRDSE